MHDNYPKKPMDTWAHKAFNLSTDGKELTIIIMVSSHLEWNWYTFWDLQRFPLTLKEMPMWWAGF